MAHQPKQPNLARVKSGNAALDWWLLNATELLETLRGQRGSELDRALTVRDLTPSGVSAITAVNTLRGVAANDGYTPPPVVIPTILTGLSVTAGLGVLFITWDGDNQSAYSHTEVWRNTSDNLATATKIATAVTPLYADYVGDGTPYFYWVRAVSTSGNPGPYNATPGVTGTAATDPTYVLSVLQGSVTESQLLASLSDRIDLIDTPATGLVDRVTASEGSILSNDNDITALQSSVGANTANITANASAVSTLDTRVTTAEGTITTNATNITALESTVNDVNAGVAANASGVSSLNTRVTTAEGTITTNATNITALESTVNDVNAGVAANASAASSLDTRVTSAEGSIAANASAITTIQSDVAGNTAAVSTEASTRATADGLLNAEYTVKVNANGYIAGMGVAVSAGASGAISSEIIMLADKFAIVTPTADATEVPNVPFVVGNVNGVPTVGIDGQLVIDGSITANHIAANSIGANQISVASLDAISAVMGTITSGTFRTAADPAYRTEITSVGNLPLWFGSGTKTEANGRFYLKDDGSMTLRDNTGAIVMQTSAGTAPVYNSALDNAQQSWAQVGGTGKPADNADVTALNTAADTAAVNGRAASAVEADAAAGATFTGDMVGSQGGMLPNWALNIADSSGKPAGIRGVESIADRTGVVFGDSTNTWVRISHATDTNIAYGFPAAPIDDQQSYLITIRHRADVQDTAGLYIRFNELNAALPSGLTHIGAGTVMEPVVTVRSSQVDLLADGAFPATVWTEDTFTYTPSTGTQWATFALFSLRGTTVQYDVDAVMITPIAKTYSQIQGTKPPSNADVTNYSDTRVANATTESAVTTIARLGGAALSANAANQPGALVITLPQSWTNTMMKMVIDVFVYSQSKSFSVACGGYNYNGTPMWYNESAQIMGSTSSNNRVRFGHDGTKCVIVIGDATDVWQYPKVIVRDFQAGYSNYSVSQWESGWAVSLVTDLTGYTFTGDFADALLDAKSIKGQGALATMDQITSSTYVANAVIGTANIISGNVNNFVHNSTAPGGSLGTGWKEYVRATVDLSDGFATGDISVFLTIPAKVKYWAADTPDGAWLEFDVLVQKINTVGASAGATQTVRQFTSVARTNSLTVYTGVNVYSSVCMNASLADISTVGGQVTYIVSARLRAIRGIYPQTYNQPTTADYFANVAIMEIRR
jgi:Domain of unknown function (DUF1983)